MQNKENQSKRIYIKSTREWVEVSEEFYREHTRSLDAFRKRQQSHGQCSCPKNKFWLCDGDCFSCEFRHVGDTLSLDYTLENEEGESVSPLESLVDPGPFMDDVICDRILLGQLFRRLNELMPEAFRIGQLRQEGLSDKEIAEMIGIKRTTYLSRLKKAKEKLSEEYPDYF